MSTSVLINPPKPKGDISHLVGRPLVPFFEDGSSKYDNFSVPAEYQIAARKFVNGYWVNEDGSRAEIGENTPTLIKKNDSLENSSNKKQQNKNQSKPSKNNNNNANKENINHKSNKSSSQLLSPTTNSQQTKAEKKKSKAANNSSPTPSSPSYAAIVARTSSAPSSTTTNETFQTPSRSKSTANPSNTAAISTSKDNYAALASPAPVNIPMPKFLGSSPAPTTASNTTPTSTDAQSCEEMSAHLMSLLKKTTISSNPSNPSVSVSSVASGASVPSGAAMPYPYPYPHHPYPYPYSASGHAVYSAPAIPQQPAQNSSSAPSQSSTSAGALMLLTGNQSGESSVRTVHVNTPANTHAAPLPPPAFAAPYPFPNYSYHHYPAAAYPSYSHPGYAPVGYGAYHHPHYMAVPPPAAAVTH